MNYIIDYTKNFKRSYKKLKKQNKNLDKMFNVINALAEGKSLDAKYKNHKLVNDNLYKDCFECHIEPDWLLIYKIKQDMLIILLVDTGSHSNLF
ncbi:MAG: type II toxin-antitoxin system YafQ family toxin [Ruminococcus sp.]|nr:type II toxin-antitoxin system YafQ family toxin [Ruminococcus sp.]